MQSNGEKIPPLSADEIIVLLASVDGLDVRLPELEGYLDAQERARADRFAMPQLRQRFVAAHGLLREWLGQWVNAAPDQVEIAHAEQGKPYLPGYTQVQFSLSHSAGLVAVAGTLGHAVGVDLQQMDGRMDWQTISAHFFSSAEQEYLHHLPEVQQREAFFALWAQKEAYGKQLGAGGLPELPPSQRIEVCYPSPDFVMAVSCAEVINFKIRNLLKKYP